MLSEKIKAFLNLLKTVISDWFTTALQLFNTYRWFWWHDVDNVHYHGGSAMGNNGSLNFINNTFCCTEILA